MAIVRGSLSALVFVALLCACEISAGRPPAPPAQPPPAAKGPPTSADAAWTRLSAALVGRWRATTAENRTIGAAYRTISKGSALVETFTSASGNETMTVMHRDGATLMATHYCAQGNQARLRATETTADRVVFEFVDVTNEGPEQSVMVKLVFQLRPDGFDQESSYRDKSGAVEATTLHFVRE